MIPCLDEAATIAAVIEDAHRGIALGGFAAEIIVADNGSTDGSEAIAGGLGATVVSVVERGYGSALRGGIAAARGKYIVMADADGSYDFRSIGPFVESLRAGSDLVMGNRFRGGIAPGAMPWKNRWLGTPVLSALMRLFFRNDIGDINCGMRAMTKSAFERMGLQTTGMEFASEMIVKASLLRMRISEVPTTLRPDGRHRAPHMRPWRDGWRHLRFLLLYSPTWLFLVPGAVIFAVGVAGSLIVLPGPLRIGAVYFDIHTLLVMAFLITLGYQVILFAILTRTFATQAGLLPASPVLSRMYRYVTLETGLVAGATAALLGFIGIVVAFVMWSHVGFERLDPQTTMRQLIPAVVLLVLGVQTVFASFFLSMLGLHTAERVHVSVAAEARAGD